MTRGQSHNDIFLLFGEFEQATSPGLTGRFCYPELGQ